MTRVACRSRARGAALYPRRATFTNRSCRAQSATSLHAHASAARRVRWGSTAEATVAGRSRCDGRARAPPLAQTRSVPARGCVERRASLRAKPEAVEEVPASWPRSCHGRAEDEASRTRPRRARPRSSARMKMCSRPQRAHRLPAPTTPSALAWAKCARCHPRPASCTIRVCHSLRAPRRTRRSAHAHTRIVGHGGRVPARDGHVAEEGRVGPAREQKGEEQSDGGGGADCVGGGGVEAAHVAAETGAPISCACYARGAGTYCRWPARSVIRLYCARDSRDILPICSQVPPHTDLGLCILFYCHYKHMYSTSLVLRLNYLTVSFPCLPARPWAKRQARWPPTQSALPQYDYLISIGDV
ncbi:hypothetical protein FA95DRAFT_1128217 [Auriscalpium vulgare]|uniref:Uncharacterized protein n=1 Tax=Auriscalpium vulgare TaxID=40419 RepID=A0ACB8R470_9AGAM|nr:hypothetical protein FA95DRAFT_1128217 [Auriscalpium vulgare]